MHQPYDRWRLDEPDLVDAEAWLDGGLGRDLRVVFGSLEVPEKLLDPDAGLVLVEAVTQGWDFRGTENLRLGWKNKNYLSYFLDNIFIIHCFDKYVHILRFT